MADTKTAPQKAARHIARRAKVTPPAPADVTAPPLRLALADRVHRVAAMLRFQSQALVEIRYVRRTVLPEKKGDGIRAERLEEGLQKAAGELRAVASVLLHLGVEIDTISPDDPRLPPGESPAPIAETYLERAASAARGGEDTFP
jgi:hypothetical protein